MFKCLCRTPQDNKDLIVRLNRIEGQIGAIKTQLSGDEEKSCMELLNQVRSAAAAMRGVWELIAARHIEECVNQPNKEKRNQAIEDIVCCLKELR